jgi:hypothetical protein
MWTNSRRLQAFTLASLPWSMILKASPFPISDSVRCRPPVPHPREIGISGEEYGTW